MRIVATRPCINYSISLEAVVWDGEQEEAFQYEPVRDDYNEDNDDDYWHVPGMVDSQNV